MLVSSSFTLSLIIKNGCTLFILKILFFELPLILSVPQCLSVINHTTGTVDYVDARL